MIGFTHIEVLRGQIAEKERELAGWRYLLAHAESVERADQAAQLPDPLLGVGTPWPNPAPEPWPAHPGMCACRRPNDPAKYHYTDRCDLIPPEKGGPDVYAAATPGETPVIVPGPSRVDLYPTSLLPPIDGSTLPPNQENALGTIASEFDAYAQTAAARDEDEKWRQA